MASWSVTDIEQNILTTIFTRYNKWLKSYIEFMVSKTSKQLLQQCSEDEAVKKIVRCVAYITLGRTVTELTSVGVTKEDICKVIMEDKSPHHQTVENIQ